MAKKQKKDPRGKELLKPNQKIWGTTSRFGQKKVRGNVDKYVIVVVKKRGKRTVTKQYKYQGGSLQLYEREAQVPKGTKYLVDYSKNRIIRSPRIIEQRLKVVKGKRKIEKKKGVSKRTKIPIIKKYIEAPKPLHAEKIVDVMNRQVNYEKRHSLREFASPMQESKFMMKILGMSATDKAMARNLLHNFDKIKLKMSYGVTIEGINQSTGKLEKVGGFTAVGMRPRELIEAIKEAELAPSDSTVNFKDDYDQVKGSTDSLSARGVSRDSVTLNRQNYKITDVKVNVKFYHTPPKIWRGYKK